MVHALGWVSPSFVPPEGCTFPIRTDTKALTMTKKIGYKVFLDKEETACMRCMRAESSLGHIEVFSKYIIPLHVDQDYQFNCGVCGDLVVYKKRKWKTIFSKKRKAYEQEPSTASL